MTPNNPDYLNIGEFASISGTSRRNLLFYDEIGLFRPAIVGDNGYRYYSIQQFYLLDTINMLKTIGMPLREIKEFLDTRTPDKAVELFSRQEEAILHEIEKLTYYHQALKTRIWRIRQASAFQKDAPFLQECEAEYYLVSERVGSADDSTMMKVYFDFFATLNDRRFDIGYPMGGVTYSKQGFNEPSERYEYQLLQKISKEQADSCQEHEVLIKPAGTYITEYQSREQQPPESLPSSMKRYLAENQLIMTGSLWEFWWLDDTVTRERKDHVYQVSIQVLRNEW